MKTELRSKFMQLLCSQRYFVLNVLVSLIIFITVMIAPVRQTGSDPKGSLLLSESILKHGSFKLNRYIDPASETDRLNYRFQHWEKNGNSYYLFPIGTSIFSLPFVAVENLFGARMTSDYDDHTAQIRIISFLAVGIYLLLYFIAQLFLNRMFSVIVAALFWFSSPFMSTMVKGLWSHNFAVFFALLAIYLSLRSYRAKKGLQSFFISFCLFSAYLCRPTMALFVVCMFLFIFLYSKREALKTILYCGIFFSLFVVFNFIEIHQLLPLYYQPKRLQGDYFWTALYGNLLSPSRGLLVYMPYLSVLVIGLPVLFKKIRSEPVYSVFAAWIVLHILAVSRFNHWWGGFCFGPRLMTDILPAFFILLIFVLKDLKGRIGIAFIMILVIVSMYINTAQGAFNQFPEIWNAEIPANQNDHLVFDWRYPQFLHNYDRHRRRLAEYNLSEQSLVPGRDYSFNSKSLFFYNWYLPDNAGIWSEGFESDLYFRVSASEIKKINGIFRINISTRGEQVVDVFLNGKQIHHYQGKLHKGDLTISFSPDRLITGFDVNHIHFAFPKPLPPLLGGDRLLSMYVHNFSIE